MSDDTENEIKNSADKGPEENGKAASKPRKNEWRKIVLLFAVIVIEGYVVLSSELLAIRQTIPFVGSGTDTISIIIAAVLMPLAFGYYFGGKFKPGLRKVVKRRFGKQPIATFKYISVRQKLIRNILIAAVFLLCALSYPVLHGFFNIAIDYASNHRLILTLTYSFLFLVAPVYLLGQTIPLVSHYFSKEKLAKITGRILFFSTLGSFMGAVFSTVFLMSTIGVHYTAALNFVLLALLVGLLSKKRLGEAALFAYALAVAGIFLNSGETMAKFYIVENNQYNTIKLIEQPEGHRHMMLNNSNSSYYSDSGERYDYINFIEGLLLPDIANADPPKKILVIGAGGFTFGLNDLHNTYHYIDIDKTLRTISEEMLLKKKLSGNKEFYPMAARAFLSSTDETYDVILMDAYLGDLTFPEHLATANFFREIRAHLAENGIVFGNFIASPTFQTRFSRHIDNTLRQAFPFVSRHVVKDNYWLWQDNTNRAANVIYIYRHNANENVKEIYTDNRNRIFFDKRQRR